MKRNFFRILAVLIFSVAVCQAQKTTGVYTSLSDKNCKTLRQGGNDELSYLGECRGVAGYRLHVLEGDLRQSINVITPQKRKFQLKFWNVSTAFSSVGDQAEWRVRGKTPTALIVRFNASENPDDSSILTSYLIVSKIAKNRACITDIVKPGANQNTEARTLADSAHLKPCKVFN